MKINYIHEGVFGSYKNSKTSGKEIATSLATEAIFEKYKDEIMAVYVKDLKELMDSRVESKFGGSEAKYRICNRYVQDLSPDAYGVGARIMARGNKVVIEQMLSWQTSFITGTRTFYTCSRELTFWEEEEKKLAELFPRYTFKIVLDWVYSPGGMHASTKITPDSKLVHRPYPCPGDDLLSPKVGIGYEVTLDEYAAYWNRFVSKAESIREFSIENPEFTSLDIHVPTDLKIESMVIRGGEKLTDLSGVAKYMIGPPEVSYNLNGFKDFMSRRSDGVDIDPKYDVPNPAFEIATKGLLSLDNLRYLFDANGNGKILCTFFLYDMTNNQGRLYDTTYGSNPTIIATDRFTKDTFKKAVDKHKKKYFKK